MLSRRISSVRPMTIMEFGDTRIEYDERGNGNLELLLIPGAVISSGFEPLASELAHASSNHFRVVSMRRRGYGGSSRAPFPFSIEDQARDCLALMDGLGLKRTHIVGHSMSGLIALQLANDVPERVGGLALIEPSLIASVPSASQGTQALSKVGVLYQSGDKAGAVDYFMQGTAGQHYREAMDRVLPAGWFDQAARELDTFFQVELPAIRSWKPVAGDRLRQAILSIYGMEKRWDSTTDSGAEFDQVLHSWFAQTQSVGVRGAYHWPHITNTARVASELTSFIGKNASQADRP